MNDPNLSAFIWSVADLLRGDYKQSDYGKVILPFTVLRRLDCTLEATKAAVLKEKETREKAGVNPEPFLGRLTGSSCYNTSPLDMKKLMGDQDHIGENLRAYMQAFSPPVRDIFERFEFHTQIDRLGKADLLYLVTEKFANIDLHPDVISNAQMGAVFEELIRKFAELSNETAGEHFTPREVIRLMVNILFIEDDDALSKPRIVRTLYDPTAGTGGMLTVAAEHLTALNPSSQLVLYGQELNAESYAICKAEMVIKEQNIENIIFGNTLSADGLPGQHFDYMLSNPPFGVEWKKIEKEIRKEAEQQGFNGRYGPGLPRVSDGSLLFLLHLISKMRPARDGGSRFGIVLNGSPLFTGSAGSGESEIRRYVLENDLVEAIIGLPTDMFYNTGISTYIWIVSNRKAAARKGKLQLIDASSFWQKMRKSLGSKRKELSPAHIEEITRLFGQFEEADRDGAPISRIFKNEEFGYRTITIERPERDSDGNIVLAAKGKGKGKPLPDAALRDTENVPLSEEVATYFRREVLPHAPDAWIDDEKTKVGYEIPFNRHFYVFKPPRPLSEIDADLKTVTDRILTMIGKLTEMSFPRYPKYKDSGVEWLGEVPEHWGNRSIRWLARRYSGGTPDKTNLAYWYEGTIPWLNSGAVNDRMITRPSTYITAEAFTNSSAKWIPEGALVMALAGQGKTKGMVARLAFPSTCNQSMAAIIPGPGIAAPFLYWWLDSNYQNIRNMAGGDLRDGLNLELLGNIQCPLPPLTEQVQVARFLDRETAKIDELVAKQRRLIELLQEKRQAVISHAVTKGLNPDAPMKPSGNKWLGDMPKHWEVKRLKHVKADDKNAFVDGPFGSNLKSEHFGDGGDVYVIESNFATQGVLELDALKTITLEHFKTINRSETRGGDIIIAKIGAQYGKSSILPNLDKPAVVSGNSLKLTVMQQSYNVKYVNWHLCNLKELGVMEDIVNATAQPALSLGEMNELPMLVPPRLEQDDIVNFLDDNLRKLASLTWEAQRAVNLLQERRTALISAAVTGKIDVRQLSENQAA